MLDLLMFSPTMATYYAYDYEFRLNIVKFNACGLFGVAALSE